MEPCKGLKDWLECLSCPHLCTKSCPIEGQNVVEEMKRQIHAMPVSKAEENKPLRA
ncbi:MAG: hypothetical protein AB1442_02000 [Nitrospirota bacterium]